MTNPSGGRRHGSGARLRAALFRAGADAFGAVFPGAPRLYPCPICALGFLESALNTKPPALTAEHVPPTGYQYGAKPLVLTCAECNNRGGSLLDAHAVKRFHAERMVRGEMTSPRRGTMEIAGLTLNVDYSATPEGFRVQVDPRRNKPVDGDMSGLFSESLGRGDVIRLSTSGDLFDNRKAGLSLLRSAYLLVFARAGYSFVFDPALEIVRRQLQQPADILVQTFSLSVPAAALTDRRVLIVTSPEHIRNATCVQFGIHVVFLPSPRDLHFYERLQDHRSREGDGAIVTFNCRPESWPTRATFDRDHGLARRRNARAGKVSPTSS
jgi:hypothetical protein